MRDISMLNHNTPTPTDLLNKSAIDSNNARMDMPKGNHVVTKIYFYLETEEGINKEFRKHVFFKMNSSLGSFLLYYIGDERVSVP